MKFAIRTRSRDEDYGWKPSYDSSGREEAFNAWYAQLSRRADDRLSLIVKRYGSQFDVYFGGFSTLIKDEKVVGQKLGERLDCTGTPIRMDVCIGQLDEATLKALLYFFCRDINGFRDILQDSIHWIDNKTWDIKSDELGSWLSQIQRSSQGDTKSGLESSIERFEKEGYDPHRILGEGNENESLEVLKSHLENYDFSHGDGLKVVVSRIPNVNAKDISQCDVLITKKKLAISQTVNAGTRKPSNAISPKLIIALVIAIVLVVLIFLLSTNKQKKVPPAKVPMTQAVQEKKSVLSVEPRSPEKEIVLEPLTPKEKLPLETH